MIAEILATGDEIRSGALVDSNSAYIAQKLEDMGIEVVRHIAVGDDLAQLVAVLAEIGKRSDIAVVTGGLGPTDDDISMDAAAAATGTQLILNHQALADLTAIFKKLNRPVTPLNRKQAMLPENAEMLSNPIGTAPGFAITIGQCRFFFMPGVPPEMRRMLAEQVLPRITAMKGDNQAYSLIKNICTFGLPESMTAERMAGFAHAFPDVKLGYRAKFPEIHLRLYLRGADEALLQSRMDEAAKWVAGKMGHKVFSMEAESMEAVVGKLLIRNKATLAVAESCTGGLISHWLTNVSGSSAYFLFSGVTYSNDAKKKVLGVNSEILEKLGSVSPETARAMAEGARRISGATYGLSTSGIAGPTGGTPQKPVGTLCVGLASSEGSRGMKLHFPYGQRRMKKKVFAMAALDQLRRLLLGYERNN
jgi:competence/damage-inducible protein CinA-like protein